MDSEITPDQVAQWMADTVKSKGYLDQEDAADKIKAAFGAEFTYENENGNLAIRRDVLSAFRELSSDSVVWDREDRRWRVRAAHDGPSRQQD